MCYDEGAFGAINVMDQPNLQRILADFRQALAEAADLAALDDVRRLHTGKKSPIKQCFGSLRDISADQRPAFAKAIHGVQQTIEAELEHTTSELKANTLNARLENEWQDLTLPGVAHQRGARHPIAVVEQRCMSVLRQVGFDVVDGPEVEHPYFNFDALNIPKDHPARDMQDTFWVDNGLLLRSHTTTVQARVLQQKPQLPIRIASVGRVYRNEAVDATHLAMFHQLEGFWVDKGLTFAHLKGLLAFIARSLYGEDRAVRFKPKFYPYTEPSVGVDLSCVLCDGDGCAACHEAGWVTILGAGMVHPNVFTEFGYDPAEVTGFAFGLGTTRMAAQWSGVKKVKSLYDQDLRVSQRLHRGSS